MSPIEQAPPAGTFAEDVREGLRHRPKYLQAKYLYDEVGSELFEAITHQPEYYPTRTEAAILRAHAADIRDAMQGHVSLVELGSGSSAKTTILLEHLLEEQERLHYVPIDISPEILNETAERLDTHFGGLATIPIASEYGVGLGKANHILSEHDDAPSRKLVLFLGSSIGNFEPATARSFLRMTRKKMSDEDALLAGFDLQKDRHVLDAAYNDRAGVTARFNLNLLARINRQLGGEFDLRRFSHCAFYNEGKERVEMHLVSALDHEVAIKGLDEIFSFCENETIHTENSYKYTMDDIDELGKTAGFETTRIFTDDKKWFALALFSPV